MLLNEARARAVVRPINQLLESRFGLTVDPADPDHLKQVQTHYEEKRETMRAVLGESEAMGHPAYAKALLISEAAALILREISPTRRMRKKKKKSS